MATKTWASKWNYLLGKEPNAPFGQRWREFFVSKFGSGVLTSDSRFKHTWQAVYSKEGGDRPFETNRQFVSVLNTAKTGDEGKGIDRIKVKTASSGEETLYSRYRADLHNIAQSNAVAFLKREYTEACLKADKENKSHPAKPIFPNPADISYNHRKYNVKEETRLMAVPDELIARLMSDPIINPLFHDPDNQNRNLENKNYITIQDIVEYGSIQSMAMDAKKLNKPEYIQWAKTWRIRLLKEGSVREGKDKIIQTIANEANCSKETIKTLLERLEKVNKWNALEIDFRTYLAKRAWSELKRNPTPPYAETGSQYRSYIDSCYSFDRTPEPPPTLAKITFYGMRVLLWPPNLLDAVVGGLTEGGLRLISKSIDYCFTNKRSKWAIGTKIALGIVTGLLIVDAACHFVSKACSVSGWADALSIVGSGAKKFWKWSGLQKCWNSGTATSTHLPATQLADEKKSAPSDQNEHESKATAQKPGHGLKKSQTGLPDRRLLARAQSHANILNKSSSGSSLVSQVSDAASPKMTSRRTSQEGSADEQPMPGQALISSIPIQSNEVKQSPKKQVHHKLTRSRSYAANSAAMQELRALQAQIDQDSQELEGQENTKVAATIAKAADKAPSEERVKPARAPLIVGSSLKRFSKRESSYQSNGSQDFQPNLPARSTVYTAFPAVAVTPTTVELGLVSGAVPDVKPVNKDSTDASFNPSLFKKASLKPALKQPGAPPRFIPTSSEGSLRRQLQGGGRHLEGPQVFSRHRL